MTNIPVWPMGHGTHNNLWMRAGLKKKFSFRLVCFYDTCDAHIVTFSVAQEFPPNLLDFLDYDKIYEALKLSLKGKDFNLVTPREDMLIKRDKFEINEWKANLYNQLTLT